MARTKPARDAKAAKPAKAARTPAAKRPAATAGRPGVFVQKPRSDIYVALLAVALGAILLGCLLLILHLKVYDFKFKATSLTTPGTTQLATLEKIPTVHL